MQMSSVLLLSCAVHAASAAIVNIDVAASGAAFYSPALVTVKSGDTVRWTFRQAGFTVTRGNHECCEQRDSSLPGSFDSGVVASGGTFDLVIDASIPPGSRVQYFSTGSCATGTRGTLWVVAPGNRCDNATTYNECQNIMGGTPTGLVPVHGSCVWCGRTTSFTSTAGQCLEPYWSAQGSEICFNTTNVAFGTALLNSECPSGTTMAIACASYPLPPVPVAHVRPAPVPCPPSASPTAAPTVSLSPSASPSASPTTASPTATPPMCVGGTILGSQCMCNNQAACTCSAGISICHCMAAASCLCIDTTECLGGTAGRVRGSNAQSLTCESSTDCCQATAADIAAPCINPTQSPPPPTSSAAPLVASLASLLFVLL